MTVRNALASAQLTYTQKGAGAPYHVAIKVWSHTYDHPDPARRSALVTEVFLAELPQNAPIMTNVKIVDRYGVDQTMVFTGTIGGSQQGWEGYKEFDTGGACGPQLPQVFWGAFSGIYDERCLADQTIDARRLQTYGIGSTQISVYNYILGPLTFSFDIALASPPTSVLLRVGRIGGNGGNPAQRTEVFPGHEEFLIRFP